ncbi:MAG: oligosaccharide flippase family protein [Nanoarchaeota archaeon]
MGNINRYVQRIKSNEFLRNTFLLLIATLIMNIFGFLFNFYVARKLGPADFGIFGVLSSLIYLLIVPLTTIQTTITKFVASFKVSNEYGKIKYLFLRSLFKLLLFGAIFIVIFFSLSNLIMDFLHIPSFIPLLLLGIFFLFSLVIPVSRGLLQGLQKFKSLGYNFILEGLSKFIGGLILVGIGLGINGALIAFIISYFLPFLFSFIPLKFVFSIDKIKFETKNIYFYSFPVLLTTFLLTAVYTIDTILVKHFLSSIEAGYYLATSKLGTIIYFASGAVTLVLFPQVTELHLKNQDHKKILKRALLIVSLLSGFITLLYFLFAKLIVLALFGQQYLEITNYIGLFALIMSIFSLVYVLCFYNLSINRMNFIYVLGFFILLEAVLVWLFHDSIMEVITILLSLLSFLLLSLLVFTLAKNEPKHNNTSI